jgi:hypothetical protein
MSKLEDHAKTLDCEALAEAHWTAHSAEEGDILGGEMARRLRATEEKRDECIREEREIRDAHWRPIVDRLNVELDRIKHQERLRAEKIVELVRAGCVADPSAPAHLVCDHILRRLRAEEEKP